MMGFFIKIVFVIYSIIYKIEEKGMIIFNQESGNTFAVTIFDDVKDITATGNSYTMTLINQTTLQTYSGITLTNLTGNTERYDLFEVTLTGRTSVDYSTAKIYLPNKGFYDYYIYYNDVLAERGLVLVTGDPIIEKYSYTKENKYYSYKKQ